MPLGGPPVTVVEAGGLPVTNLGAAGGTPMTVVEAPLYGMPITLAEGAYPVSLLDTDGNFWSSGPPGAGDLLDGESAGLAIDFTLGAGLGSVAVKGHTTNLNDVPVDQFLTNSGTSPKLVLGPTGVYRWSPHNLFVNSTSAPATQSVVTLITGATYTYGITGTGSLTGSVGASGVASAGSPVTFVATGTGATFTVAGSVTSMWINRGPAQTLPYHATGAAPWFGVPIEYSGGGYYALVEPQATNLIAKSQELDVWVANGATITVNATAAPDGTLTADKIVETATAGLHWVYRDAVLTAAPYTGSICLKAAERTWCYLRFDTGVSNGAWFNLAAGTIGTVQAGVTATITPLGNGWYRCALTVAATAANWFLVPGTSTGDGVEVYTGNGVSGIYAWGAQIELGSAATSPIPTFAATVTRALDNFNVATSAFPFAPAAPGSIIRWGVDTSLDGNPYYVELNDGTTAEWIVLYRAGGSSAFLVVDGGAIQSNPLFVGPIVLNATVKLGVAWALDDFAVVQNAGAPSIDPSGTVPSPNVLYVASPNAPLCGRLLRFVYVPRRMTNVELQAKTT